MAIPGGRAVIPSMLRRRAPPPFDSIADKARTVIGPPSVVWPICAIAARHPNKASPFPVALCLVKARAGPGVPDRLSPPTPDGQHICPEAHVLNQRTMEILGDVGVAVEILTPTARSRA
jgi:hypothetical protein